MFPTSKDYSAVVNSASLETSCQTTTAAARPCGLWPALLPSLERAGQPPEGRLCLRLGRPGLREKLPSKLPRDSGCEAHWDVLRVVYCPCMCAKG